MKILKNILFLIICSNIVVLVVADNVSNIISKYPALSLEQRVKKLEQIVRSSKGADTDVAKHLLTDTKYEIAKREIASKMLLLAESRVKNLPDNQLELFSRKVAIYDALSILQSLPLAWLTSTEREQALALSQKLDNTLVDSVSNQGTNDLYAPVGDETIHSKVTNVIPNDLSIGDVIITISNVLNTVLAEDLSDISKAKPNGNIQKALGQCKVARKKLMSLVPETTSESAKKLENAMSQLNKTILMLKNRQRIKYTLWAEGRYRETDPTDVSQELSDNKAMQLYIYLSKVNVALLAEPSLAREITKRLFELYDIIENLKSKEKIRYTAVLSQSETLNDF